MNMLAHELAAKTRHARFTEKEKERRDRRIQLRDAVIIAREITSELPAFLASAAEQGHHRAYIVSFTRYEPFPARAYHWFWSHWHKVVRPINNPTLLRLLDGVPKHVAEWGIEHGFRVSIGRAPFWEVEPAFGPETENYMHHGTGEGIHFYW